MDRQLLFISLVFLALLSGCSSSASQAGMNERDLPEICRHFDFSKDPAMAEECGIRQTRYKSYKNIPAMRYLIAPKDAQLVLDKRTGHVEFRMNETLPVRLDQTLSEQIDFSDRAKMQHLKNQYIYKELYPTSDTRLRVFQLRIPVPGDAWVDYCFRIPDKKSVDDRKRTIAVHTLETISCDEFREMVSLYSE